MHAGIPSTAWASQLFDALQAVDAAFMLGSWRGQSFASGHPLDGVLEAYHWRGKRFDSVEAVHPLVFTARQGHQVCVNPAWLRPGLWLAGRVAVPRARWLARLFQAILPLLATTRPRARLRTTTWRGKPGATMVYDQLPIQDGFRRIDDNTVLGRMDAKGIAAPFFFILRRERADPI